MKKIITLSFLCLLSLISHRGIANDHVTFSLQNPTSTSNTLEFDVYIVNDGTSSLKLGGYQFGVNFATYILNGGTPAASSYTYIANSRDAIFSGLTAPSVAYNNSQLKVTCTTVPLLNAVTIVNGTQYKLGRFRFTNTTSWLPASAPALNLQLTFVVGKTQCIATCFINSDAVSTPLQNATSTASGISSAAINALLLNIPLPVHITSFTGNIHGEADDLTWTTAQEQNNSYFNLQHSVDGIHFETIQTIGSLAEGGNSAVAIHYQAVNSQPNVGHNYYRLEQVDIDGQTSIATQVIDLERRAASSTINLYPNPCNQMIQVGFAAATDESVNIKIMDMNGRILKTILANVSEGLNTININLDELNNGNYFLQVYENNQLSSTQKFLKLN